MHEQGLYTQPRCGKCITHHNKVAINHCFEKIQIFPDNDAQREVKDFSTLVAAS